MLESCGSTNVGGGSIHRAQWVVGSGVRFCSMVELDENKISGRAEEPKAHFPGYGYITSSNFISVCRLSRLPGPL
jgi:hypothetical protein